MTSCGSPLSRSLLGVKRTWLVAADMSAPDPKRTFDGPISYSQIMGTKSRCNRCHSEPQTGVHVMRKWSAVAFVIIMMTAPLPALAYTQEDADACTPDAMRLCQNAIPDASRVAQCLVQNKQQLSPACTSVFNRPRGASVDRERSTKTQRTSY
jgi:hypothetical protein